MVPDLSSHSHSDISVMVNAMAGSVEIARLLKLERFYRDTAQWDLCRDAFHPDASKTYINVAWLVLQLYS